MGIFLLILVILFILSMATAMIALLIDPETTYEWTDMVVRSSFILVVLVVATAAIIGVFGIYWK